MNGPLHIGHAFTATRTDVYARFRRMQGYNVLFPWAWHWTGQPIVAAAERLARGDPAMIREFVEIDHVPRDQLDKFYDPKYMAEYYTKAGQEVLRQLGISIDWRRTFHTTELEPTFSKFVTWQYSKLRESGYVAQGTHPVVWCPRDQSPTGDHDRLQGEGVTWEEYTLILFQLDNSEGEEKDSQVFLPAATFRPETIFGVTNIWINPDYKYAEILFGSGEKWIVSIETIPKLSDQLKKFEVTREFFGRELIGKRVHHPIKSGIKLIILPAKFVNPNSGTGVVYSVPAHAPVDYVALRDLKKDGGMMALFHLEPKEIEAISPIPLVRTEGMSDYPAEEIVERLGISDQSDPKLLLATEEIYKKEFHSGSLNENCDQYRGMKISEAKKLIITELRSRGLADVLYELPEPVVCRCMTPCTVKILEDQWFLRYSDRNWKKLTHECIDSGLVFPDSIRQLLHDTVEWLQDWPCARRVGLGTPLPWARGWIIETLSDSTIYMCFYTIKAALDRLQITADKLSDEFFDYVFLGRGEAESVASRTGIDAKEVEAMRSEFLYWYPVDLRNSAKELLTNHLVFYIFHHVAFFPRSLWPRSISVNGMLSVDGTKMSKSKGNVITISAAVSDFGPDVLRATVISGAEGLDDLDWKRDYALDMKNKIESLKNFVISLQSKFLVERISSEARNEKVISHPDMWFEDQIQRHVKRVNLSLEALKTKSAFQEAFYAYWNTIRRYLSRSHHPDPALVRYGIETWIRLLSPFIPFTSEELNFKMGNTNLVSASDFPREEKAKYHPEAKISELLLERLLEDAQKIFRLIATKPSKLYVYTSSHWKHELMKMALTKRKEGAKTSEIIEQFFSSNPSVSKKEIAEFLPKLLRLANDLGDEFFADLDDSGWSISRAEGEVYESSADFLKDKLGMEIIVSSEEDPNKYDPMKKSKQALPFKPALFIV
jgi:leucyl-tRNA synthetase